LIIFATKKTVVLQLIINLILKKMEELVSKIKAEFDALTTDAKLQIEKGNKAAGTRARKSSLDLEKLLKEFRKASLEASKK
jgi:hypothetical protein